MCGWKINRENQYVLSFMIGSVRHIVVVVGCQRSGTTLTGQILGTNPNAVLIDEFDGLYDWFHSVTDGAPGTDHLTSLMLKKSATKYQKPDDRIVSEGGNYMLSDNVDMLVLKAPNLTYDFNKLASMSERIDIIYPVRDPRAVVASMERLSNINFVDNQCRLIAQKPNIQAIRKQDLNVLNDQDQPDWIRAATVWKIKSGLAPEIQNAGLHVFQFRYEDIVADPDQWVQRMSAFCDYEFRVERQTKSNVYKGLGPGDTDRSRTVDEAGIASWQLHMDSRKAAEILTAAEPLAGNFNYV